MQFIDVPPATQAQGVLPQSSPATAPQNQSLTQAAGQPVFESRGNAAAAENSHRGKGAAVEGSLPQHMGLRQVTVKPVWLIMELLFPAVRVGGRVVQNRRSNSIVLGEAAPVGLRPSVRPQDAEAKTGPCFEGFAVSSQAGG